MMKYQQRQLSFVIIGILAMGMAANAIFIFAPELLPQPFKSIEALYQTGIESWEYYAYTINVLIFLTMLNFCSMTIAIDKQKIVWGFLLKVPTKSILLKNITSVTVVKNRWWTGWGIRKVAKGWLYNVSGFDAIEINEKSGKVTRLGSADAKNLARKLNKMRDNSVTKEDYHG